jgi:hypothetical protein
MKQIDEFGNRKAMSLDVFIPLYQSCFMVFPYLPRLFGLFVKGTMSVFNIVSPKLGLSFFFRGYFTTNITKKQIFSRCHKERLNLELFKFGGGFV